MSTATFFTELFSGAKPVVKDTFNTLLNAYKEVEIAKAQAPVSAAAAEQASMLRTPNQETTNAQTLNADQYQAAARQAAGSIKGLPQWAQMLLAGSAALLVIAVLLKLVKG